MGKVYDLGSNKFSVCLPPREKDSALCEVWVGGPHMQSKSLRNPSLRALSRGCTWGARQQCFEYDARDIQHFYAAIRNDLVTDNNDLFPEDRIKSCAVVGSGHTLRCGAEWGAFLDDPAAYSSIWRTTRPPLTAENHVKSKAGRRTTYALLNCVEAQRNNPDRSRLTCLKGGSIRNDMITRRGPGSSLGMGKTEGFTVDLAISMCEQVDVYGYGMFGADAGSDLVFANWYDRWTALNCSRQVAQCYQDAIPYAVDKSSSKFTQYCNFDNECNVQWQGAKKSQDPMDWFFKYELRLHVLDALGFIRWIWW